MNLENEHRRSPGKGSDKLDVVLNKPKISYSRDFLLSLSNLDICKKLPSGFDESLLCEFDDAVQSIQDRPRIPGSLPLQGFRRNEHRSSPPTRGASGNYSGRIYGKWDTLSSGRSDPQSDSQSDRDSDFGRHYGHQSRRSWQSTEHNGLLGSGLFPRPSGYTAGVSAPKVSANEPYQLSKSNEPYHPPRAYKAVPYSRRDTDSLNDETFGLTECNNEDRAEEERRRRASFEMMRKEQQKALQEKQKLNVEKHKSSDVSDFCEVLEDNKEEKRPFFGDDGLEGSAATSTLSSDLDKLSFASHSLASRPLVPPGFKSNMLERSSGLKFPFHHPLMEEGKPVSGEIILGAEVNLVQNGINYGLEQRLSQGMSSVGEQPEEKIPLLDKGGNVNSSRSLDIPVKRPGMDDQLPHVSSHLDSQGTLHDLEIIDLHADALEGKTVDDSKEIVSISILDKIFGSTFSMNDERHSSAELHDSKTDGTWTINSVSSSKFAPWFFEEEAKPADDNSSGRPNNLLSLIVNGGKGRFQVSDAEAAEHFPHDVSSNTLRQSNELTVELPSAANGVSDQAYVGKKEKTTLTVLTCEDLEQSILTEYTTKATRTQSVSKGWITTGANTGQPNEHVDDHASLHLLSLLQKGTGPRNISLNSGVDIDLADKSLVYEENVTAINDHEVKENGKNILNSGNTLTLETLFGSAFMKELKSVEAPVSIQGGSVDSAEVDAPEPYGLSFSATDNAISSSAIDKIGLQRPSHEHTVLASDQRQQLKPSKVENWLAFDDSQIGTTSSNHHPKEVLKHGGFEVGVEFQLPEENLIAAAEHWNHQMSTFMPAHNSIDNTNISPNAPINIMDKLAAASPVVKDERVMIGSESLPLPHGPFVNMERKLPYHGLQVQQPSPQLQPPRMAQVNPLHNHLGSQFAHLQSQLKFLGPEPMFKHDSPINHQLSSNMIHHPLHQPNIGNAGFDIPSQNSMLHQIQMSGNHTQVSPDFPKGGPLPLPGNQAAGYIQEMNQMRGFPLGSRQPNISNLGLPIPAPNINSGGGNPPQAFQTLVEMELRANSKHIHPVSHGHNQGIYGREVDMGFQYR